MTAGDDVWVTRYATVTDVGIVRCRVLGRRRGVGVRVRWPDGDVADVASKDCHAAYAEAREDALRRRGAAMRQAEFALARLRALTFPAEPPTNGADHD